MKIIEEWEKSTKELLQTLHKELSDLNEIAAAKEFELFLCDVTEELKSAEKRMVKTRNHWL